MSGAPPRLLRWLRQVRLPEEETPPLFSRLFFATGACNIAPHKRAASEPHGLRKNFKQSAAKSPARSPGVAEFEDGALGTRLCARQHFAVLHVAQRVRHRFDSYRTAPSGSAGTAALRCSSVLEKATKATISVCLTSKRPCRQRHRDFYQAICRATMRSASSRVPCICRPVSYTHLRAHETRSNL